MKKETWIISISLSDNMNLFTTQLQHFIPNSQPYFALVPVSQCRNNSGRLLVDRSRRGMQLKGCNLQHIFLVGMGRILAAALGRSLKYGESGSGQDKDEWLGVGR